jgi:hypothetical protein
VSSNERLKSGPYQSERVLWQLWEQMEHIRRTYGETEALGVANDVVKIVKRRIELIQKYRGQKK